MLKKKIKIESSSMISSQCINGAMFITIIINTINKIFFKYLTCDISKEDNAMINVKTKRELYMMNLC